MKKNKKISAFKNGAYARFIQKRDRALEKILWTHQKQLTSVTRQFLSTALESVLLRHGRKVFRQELEQALYAPLTEAKRQAYEVMRRARREAFLLAGVAEAEAMARLQGHGKYTFTTQQSLDNNLRSWNIVDHYFSQLAHKVVDRAHHSLSLTDDSKEELIRKVLGVFPKVRRAKRPEELIPEITEAKGKPRPTDIAVGIVDDAEWEKMLDSYKAKSLPKYRGPEDVIDKRTLPAPYRIPEDQQIYGWQLEREMTEDFITAVREGVMEGAVQNGVDDFIWIAVLDDRTCEECCEWRHGMLVSEIEKDLGGGGEGCDSLVPPLHPNCRCRLVPAISKDLVDTKSNAEDFEKWLKT